jgi:hypothetical protein
MKKILIAVLCSIFIVSLNASGDLQKKHALTTEDRQKLSKKATPSYSCSCGKTCSTEENYNIHKVRRHTTERPYKCPYCNKYACKIVYDLKPHVKNIHPEKHEAFLNYYKTNLLKNKVIPLPTADTTEETSARISIERSEEDAMHEETAVYDSLSSSLLITLVRERAQRIQQLNTTLNELQERYQALENKIVLLK